MVELKQNAYAQSQSTAIDAGLREYMMKVYNYMTSGLAISGLVAWGFSQSPTLMASNLWHWPSMGCDARSSWIYFLFRCKITKNVLIGSSDDLLGICSRYGNIIIFIFYTHLQV